MSERVKKGFYKHHNGPIYFVTSVGTLDEHGHGNPDAPRIVNYESTQSCNNDDGLSLSRMHWEKDFVRPEVWPDGVTRPRFVRVE